MEEKKCSCCKQILKVDNFTKNRTKQDGYQLYCKSCTKKKDKKYYTKSKSKYHFRNKKQVLKSINYVDTFRKSNKCCKCGDERWYILDFHHTDPSNKLKDVGTLRHSGNFLQLKDEMIKCILLCKNCHYEFHYLEKLNNITIQDYLK